MKSAMIYLIQKRFLSSAVPLPSNDVVRRNLLISFKEWLRSASIYQFDSIFKILNDSNEGKDRNLSHMKLHLSEHFVLQALSYGKAKYGILSCLKFFDWAGHQAHFSHTRATFHSIFRILSRAKLTRVMLDFLNSYDRHPFLGTGYVFRSTIVLGYTLAGQIPYALHLIGKMQFLGLSLDPFCCNILLHVMIDNGYSDAADAMLARMTAAKTANKATRSVVVKSLCRKRRFSDAEAYIRGVSGNGYGLSTLIDALCQFHHFHKAWSLIQEFRGLDQFIMPPSYRVWIKNLTIVGNVDGALEFLDTVKREERFFPGAFTYNFLLFALLKLNRVRDVFHLLMDMQENGIAPDKSTLSAAFCFFCKVGLTDVALDLNEYASELCLSPNLMAYSYLISSLCEEGNTRDAWRLLDSLMKRGVFPYRSTFLNLGRALSIQRKFGIMKEILFLASQRNMIIADSLCQAFIIELCRCKKPEEAYLLFSEFPSVPGRKTYVELIHWLSRLNRGDIASHLLIEMQDNGFEADRSLFLSVFTALFRSENPDLQFLKLLETQTHRHGPSAYIFNIFIEGAGWCRKADLVRHVYEVMIRCGIKPNLQTQKVILQSYFKNLETSKAIQFVEDLRSKGKLKNRLSNLVVLGLCSNNRNDLALSFMKNMEKEGVTIKSQCYEEVIFNLCKRKQFEDAVSIVWELEKDSRITTFIGNTLITAALASKRLYEVWTQMRRSRGNDVSCLYDVVRLLSSDADTCATFEELEQMIEVCYPMNLYTYNLLVRWYSMRDTEGACMVFDKMIERGYRPNQWSFRYVLEGFWRHGDTSGGLRWLRQMEKRGFNLNFL